MKMLRLTAMARRRRGRAVGCATRPSITLFPGTVAAATTAESWVALGTAGRA